MIDWFRVQWVDLTENFDESTTFFTVFFMFFLSLSMVGFFFYLADDLYFPGIFISAESFVITSLITIIFPVLIAEFFWWNAKHKLKRGQSSFDYTMKFKPYFLAAGIILTWLVMFCIPIIIIGVIPYLFIWVNSLAVKERESKKNTPKV